MPDAEVLLWVVGHRPELVELQAQQRHVVNLTPRDIRGQQRPSEVKQFVQLLRKRLVPQLHSPCLQLDDLRLKAVHPSPEGDTRVSLGHQPVARDMGQVLRLVREGASVRPDEAGLSRRNAIGLGGGGRGRCQGGDFCLLPDYELYLSVGQVLAGRRSDNGPPFDPVGAKLLSPYLGSEILFRNKLHLVHPFGQTLSYSVIIRYCDAQSAG